MRTKLIKQMVFHSFNGNPSIITRQEGSVDKCWNKNGDDFYKRVYEDKYIKRITYFKDGKPVKDVKMTKEIIL